MRRLLALSTATLLLAAACGGTAVAPSPSASTAASAAATATPKPSPFKLVVSYSNIIGDELPLWVTKEGGFFADNALEIGDLQNIASAQGVPAIISGQVQVAQVGGSEVLSANAEGADLVIVAQLAGVYPFVLEVSADIKTVADLKGKKIGVSSVGSSSDIATRAALRKMGLDPDKDVVIVAVGSAAQRTAAMLGGAIQGGVSQPPDSLAVEEKGFHPIYDLAGQKLPSANTSVVVTRAFMNANKAVVQRYVDSLVQGIKRMKADRAFSIDVLKKYFKSTDDKAMAATYDFYAQLVTATQPFPRVEMFADAQSILGAKSEKVKTYDVSKMLDTSFVQSAVDRGLDKK
ncbi:MAG TPA: ABC transporter substrate-binding protein [Candidatus Limnocylindria bacterium]|nr:ABC transporter substrate-binding protein [Candidatus Limnocylindria bacterium]